MAETASSITPMLAYDDAPAAIDFLVRAFGFEEQTVYPMDDGRIGHAELTLEGSLVMLASVYHEFGFGSPRGLPAVHAQLYCVVSDVDAHYERARAEGATVIGAPLDDDHGGRSYRAFDSEGGRWIFSTPQDG